jgi:hypothetical protein
MSWDGPWHGNWFGGWVGEDGDAPAPLTVSAWLIIARRRNRR